ncbi:HAD family hydrolase [Plantactinospora sp. GCM10030261]|uniref:HAD family hydrolase n=1 Tax=Plantactinospora sp. GCM10030261 TaxID=3273420 RepID=UPI0036066059
MDGGRRLVTGQRLPRTTWRRRQDFVDPEKGEPSLCHPDLTPGELVDLLSTHGLGPTTATLTIAGTTIVDIAPAGIDKASGVLRALDVVGVAAEDTVAFGDMPVDIPMLTLVGHGVAMDNAHPDVLAAATSVTDGVEDDGFSRFVDRLVDVRSGYAGAPPGPSPG